MTQWKRYIKPRESGKDYLYLISDGFNVSIGWYDTIYSAYDLPIWHDIWNKLRIDCFGWPDVTHWQKFPKPPPKDSIL